MLPKLEETPRAARDCDNIKSTIHTNNSRSTTPSQILSFQEGPSNESTGQKRGNATTVGSLAPQKRVDPTNALQGCTLHTRFRSADSQDSLCLLLDRLSEAWLGHTWAKACLAM
ncbi:unnamed protein product [Ectocarpus fasciculatus]